MDMDILLYMTSAFGRSFNGCIVRPAMKGLSYVTKKCKKAQPHFFHQGFLLGVSEYIETGYKIVPLLTSRVRKAYSWEAWVIDHYDRIKEKCPDKFC